MSCSVVWLPDGRSPLTPVLTRHWPLLPSLTPTWSCIAVSMETPLCLLPGLPLVRPGFSHLLSGWWDSSTAARGASPPTPPLLPSDSLCPCFLPGRAGSRAQTQTRQSTWDCFPSRYLDSRFCHLPTENGVRSSSTCLCPLPGSAGLLGLACPSHTPLIQKRACLHLQAWSPSWAAAP